MILNNFLSFKKNSIKKNIKRFQNDKITKLRLKYAPWYKVIEKQSTD